LGQDLSEKFADCAYTISELCSAFCKLRRLTNCAYSNTLNSENLTWWWTVKYDKSRFYT